MCIRQLLPCLSYHAFVSKDLPVAGLIDIRRRKNEMLLYSRISNRRTPG